MKHFPDNKKLTDRKLTLKVIILKSSQFLSQTSASSAGGLHTLDIRFMARTENKYSFSFNKLSKSWRQGKSLLLWSFVVTLMIKIYVLLQLLMNIYCVLLNGGKKVTSPALAWYHKAI